MKKTLLGAVTLLLLTLVWILARYNSPDRAVVDATRIAIRNLSNALGNYRLDCNRYPTTEQGLKALREKPTIGPECRSYSMEGYVGPSHRFNDGYGRPFIYESDGINYRVTSYGRDGKTGGEGPDADINSDQFRHQ